MMKIAILGATSQIAQDLTRSLSQNSNLDLWLFARQPEAVSGWLKANNLNHVNNVKDYADFPYEQYDVVINFVGIGDPAKAIKLGSTILEITLCFDEMVLGYLKKHPTCKYIFLSSGAVYGNDFSVPVNKDSVSKFDINNISSNDWYGIAKFHAECRHRAYSEFQIIDLRVFNYFSHTQDIQSHFFILDILRSIHKKNILKTSTEYIVRDFIHPSDFHSLIQILINLSEINTAVDCYSAKPIEKPNLLLEMQKHFGLIYETHTEINSSTKSKIYYFSENHTAAAFGYAPQFTSLETILQESSLLLSRVSE